METKPQGIAPVHSLSTEEVTILNAIGSDEKQIDEIIQISGLPTARVHVVLLGLELKKRVKQAPGKLYQQVI
jgi:predicted Rossmann fold nucleotide-binding protein DprA/Smf involved in DNA uptake